MAYAQLFHTPNVRLWIGALVSQPVQPYGLAISVDTSVQRAVIAGKAPVHLDDIGLGYGELAGNCLDGFDRQIPVLNGVQSAFYLAQAKEQLLLRSRGAHPHQRPRAQNVLLDRRADPPDGIGGE